MEFLGELLGTVASGGITGLFGTALSGLFGWLGKKQEFKNQKMLKEFGLKELELEANSMERQLAIVSDEKKYVSDAQAQTASYKEASTSILQGQKLDNGHVWALLLVDMVRMLMRPMITLFSLYCIYMMLPAGFTLKEDALAAHAIIYIGVTATLWYFGSRQIEKFSMKVR